MLELDNVCIYLHRQRCCQSMRGFFRETRENVEKALMHDSVCCVQWAVFQFSFVDWNQSAKVARAERELANQRLRHVTNLSDMLPSRCNCVHVNAMSDAGETASFVEFDNPSPFYFAVQLLAQYLRYNAFIFGLLSIYLLISCRSLEWREMPIHNNRIVGDKHDSWMIRMEMCSKNNKYFVQLSHRPKLLLFSRQCLRKTIKTMKDALKYRTTTINSL